MIAFVCILELTQALVTAAKNNEEEKINDILSSIKSTSTKTDIISATYEENTALFWACWNDNANIRNILVDSGGNLEKSELEKAERQKGKVIFEYVL